MPGESSISDPKLFDPMKGVRKVVINERDRLKGTEDRNRHAQHITHSIATFLLRPYRDGGGDLQELAENSKDESLKQRISAALESKIDSKGFLGKNSLATAKEIAQIYTTLVLDLANEMAIGHEIPSSGKIGIDFTDLYRNGEMKDKLIFVTPKEHHFANNFNLAVKTVNEILGLRETNLVSFGELQFQYEPVLASSQKI